MLRIFGFDVTLGEGIMIGIEKTDIDADLDLIPREDLNVGQDLDRCPRGKHYRMFILSFVCLLFANMLSLLMETKIVCCYPDIV